MNGTSVWVGGGVNSWDTWGNAYTQNNCGCKIVRSCIVNASSPNPDLGSIVAKNRAAGAITIIALFGIENNGQTECTGANPVNQSYYTNGQFASTLKSIATQFAGSANSDVWIDPWNEPTFNNDSEWTSFINTCYNTIRGAGNNNIILLPTGNWDSDETFYQRNTSLVRGMNNVVTTIHCYSNWNWDTTANIQNRFQGLLNVGVPVIVGEFGGDQYVPDPSNGIQAAVNLHIPGLGWSWLDGGGNGNLSMLDPNWNITTWGNTWIYGWMPKFVPGPSGGPIANGTYFIVPACQPSGAVDAWGGGTTDGTGVGIWTTSGLSNPNENKWALTLVATPNIYSIRNTNTNNEVLDCQGAQTSNGTKVQLWTNYNSANQQWKVIKLSNGKYKLMPNNASSSVLDVAGGNIGSNLQLYQDYTSSGDTSQMFSFTKAN